MTELSLPEAFDCLGVVPEAGLVQARRAYQERRSLYAEDALASYALLDPEARRRCLERIEAAYRRVLQELTGAAGKLVSLRPPTETTEAPPAAGESESSVDPVRTPGLYLKQARERAGLSLDEIARHTKVGTMKLAGIESERLDLLPAPVYLRGFVMQYARLVGLPDPARIAECYLNHCREAGERPS